MALNPETPAEGSEWVQSAVAGLPDARMHQCVLHCFSLVFFVFFLNPAPEPFLKHNNQAVAVTLSPPPPASQRLRVVSASKFTPQADFVATLMTSAL